MREKYYKEELIKAKGIEEVDASRYKIQAILNNARAEHYTKLSHWELLQVFAMAYEMVFGEKVKVR